MPQTNVKHWRRLDNAAKLFPAASSKRDTRVFRFYCELKEDIQQEILQKAVDRTLEKYPIFLSVLRKGLFWHYLEQSNKRPVVREEYKEPCSSLYIRDKRDLLFEVTYYKKRINFEVFHVLTDGTGASEFVRELVKNYCIWHIMRMDWRMWFCQSIRRAFSIRKQMDLKDIIPTRQTAKRRKNRQRISFAETGVSLEACRRQRQKFRSKN